MTALDIHPACELRVVIQAERVRGKDKDGKEVWEKDTDRARRLAARPHGFQPLRGSYKEVAAEATRLNAVQQRAGFLDYLYFPEPVGSSLLGARNA